MTLSLRVFKEALKQIQFTKNIFTKILSHLHFMLKFKIRPIDNFFQGHNTITKLKII